VVKLAACVAAALPALASAQSTSLYGLADIYFGQQKAAGKTATVVNSGGMSTSYWGIGGNEDLGGGLKVVYALEGFYQQDTGANGRFPGDSFFARNAYVGFDGGFGQALFGRNTTPYFLSTIIFNPFGDSFTFSPMVLHTFLGSASTQVNGDTGFKNSIRYTTKMVNGLKGDFVYSAGNENNTAPKGTNRAYDLSVFYFNGPIGATAVYRNINLDTAAISSSQKSWQLGGSYDLKVAKLFAQYQNTTLDATGAADFKGKTFQIGASIPAGPGSVLASLASSKYTGNTAATGDKRNTWALGYDYPLSKRTDLYAVYTDDQLKNPDVKNSVIGFGIRHRF
jgi:predicted porin